MIYFPIELNEVNNSETNRGAAKGTNFALAPTLFLRSAPALFFASSDFVLNGALNSEIYATIELPKCLKPR
jgi:hypothetical protein